MTHWTEDVRKLREREEKVVEMRKEEKSDEREGRGIKWEGRRESVVL